MITRMDEFAARAMQAMVGAHWRQRVAQRLSKPTKEDDERLLNEIAVHAWRFADAMERERPPPAEGHQHNFTV